MITWQLRVHPEGPDKGVHFAPFSRAIRAALEAGGVVARKPVITSCGSSVTTGILWLALDSIGEPPRALYDGSWADSGSCSDEILTEAAGAHPLFDGVCRVVLTGQPEPEVEESSGSVTVRAPGFTAQFQAATLVRNNGEIIVRLNRSESVEAREGSSGCEQEPLLVCC